jgi:hypothetical protein
MKKRILVTLLAVPMAMLAWHEENPYIGGLSLGATQASGQTTGISTGSEYGQGEAILGTQSATIRQPNTTITTGGSATQAYTR